MGRCRMRELSLLNRRRNRHLELKLASRHGAARNLYLHGAARTLHCDHLSGRDVRRAPRRHHLNLGLCARGFDAPSSRRVSRDGGVAAHIARPLNVLLDDVCRMKLFLLRLDA